MLRVAQLDLEVPSRAPTLGPALALLGAVVGTLPWTVLGFTDHGLGVVSVAALSGLAILCAAFLLSWAVEVAELDVPPAIAISVLALVAVLPEYAVDATFAWKAGTDPAQAAYAVANMTGGNRLLLGVGWAVMVLLAAVRLRLPGITLPAAARIDIAVLLLASTWVLVPVALGRLHLIDTAVMVALYVFYLIAASRSQPDPDEVDDVDEAHELVGASQLVGRLTFTPRWVVISVMLVGAAGVILLAAEPFAEALVHSGEQLGIDQFLLVQWLAPLASEAPEFIVAALLVLRGQAAKGLMTLISSKVNQWTLLVGTLPAVTSLAAGTASVLPLDDRQREEVLLTAAQSLFGVMLIANRKLGRWEAAALALLFVGQVVIQDMRGRVAFAVAYLLLAMGLLLASRKVRGGLVDAVRATVRAVSGGRR